MQGVEPDEAGGVVLVVSPARRDRAGFHRGNHISAGAEFTQFSFVWLPARRKNQSAAATVRAAAVADQEFP
jgi:hypothetical protein